MAVWDEPNIELKCRSVCFWPLTASITMEVKNYDVHVTTQYLYMKNQFWAGFVWGIIFTVKELGFFRAKNFTVSTKSL